MMSKSPLPKEDNSQISVPASEVRKPQDIKPDPSLKKMHSVTKRKSVRVVNKSNRNDEQKLQTETDINDDLKIKFNTELNKDEKYMHQNTFQSQLKPYENIIDDRNLIDNLVDEKQPSNNASPAHTQKNEIIVKKSEQCKSQFVLETNKSMRSRSNISENSDLVGISNSSKQSGASHKNNVPMSMDSFNTNNKGESFMFPQVPIIENKTLLAVLGRNERDFIPEAMPIIRRISLLNPKEPDLYTKLRKRNTQVMKQQQNEEEVKQLCEHDNSIEMWKCNLCNLTLSRFGLFWDDSEGRVQTYSKIVYENSFLEDFQIDFNSQYQQFIQKVSEKKPASHSIIYTCYEPSNVQELREYMMYLMTKRIKKLKKDNFVSPLGNGSFKNLSSKLCKYLMTNVEKQRRLKLQNNTLWFDSIFESGNLLQAQKSLTIKDTYNLFMQVDTNTRGHQQWFYFRVKGGIKNKTYTFNIMNFTKPGVTGGRGYKSNEYEMRIHYRSKQRTKATNSHGWQSLTHESCQCEYKKTNVTRRKKDVIAAGADSDQEDWVEEEFQKQTGGINAQQGRDLSLAIPDSNPLHRQETQKERPRRRRVFYYYALQFKYQFEFDDDTVYFAFAKPCPYSEILEDLHKKERQLMPKPQVTTADPGDQSNLATQSNATHANPPQINPSKSGKYIQNDQMEIKYNPAELLEDNQFQKNVVIDNPSRLMYYQRTELCRTMTGLPLYKIVISRDLRCQKKNQIVLISSRVHSGETPASEVFRGIYDFITSDCREAKYLRRFYTFIFIPCMNPDGVVCGNYRNSVAGVDLNRQWINPEPQFHPEVLGVKGMMQQIKEEDKREIWIFCDIHGHSKKKNSFFYGCNTAANGGFLSWTIVRLLPRILAQKTHMFNYKDSRFRVEPYKIGTARVVAWKQFAITHSFTLENSFYGYELGEGEHKCFTQEDYKDIGLKFTMAIYDMHFIWKDIKRELRITHGWLKPRTLNEMTGIPLAQKVAEETAAAKEEVRKQKAIQQYEEYLKRFYKWKNPYQRKALFNRQQSSRGIQETNTLSNNIQNIANKQEKTRNSLNQEKMFTNEVISKHQNDDINLQGVSSVQRTIDQPMNEDLKEALTEEKPEPEIDEEEFFYRLHTGLVKIQAQVRGFLARQSVAKIFALRGKLKQIQSNKELREDSAKKLDSRGLYYETGSDFGNLRTPGIENNSSGGEFDILQRSNTDQLILRAEGLSDSAASSQDTAQSLSIFAGKGFQRPRLDWRQFFKDEELDKAYQIVEVEQRDETDHNTDQSSMGSNSNPSEDNFDEEQMYQDVYGIKNVNEVIKTRKQKYDQFVEKVQNDEIAKSEILGPFKPKPRESLSESKGILKDKELNLRGKNKSTSQKQKVEKQNPIIQKLVPLNSNFNNEEMASQPCLLKSDQKDKDRHILPNPSIKNLNIGGKSHSPMTKKEISHETMLQMNVNSRRPAKSNNQPRAFTQNTTYQQGQMPSNPVRMIQQSYIKQQTYHRKENINQVIKDCFITKKMNTNSMQSQMRTAGIAQSQAQWTPYQNHTTNHATHIKQNYTSQQQRKQLIKSQGHPQGSQKQSSMTPKKVGWVSAQKPGTAQVHESLNLNQTNFFMQEPTKDKLFQVQPMNQDESNFQKNQHQQMAQTQNQLLIVNQVQPQKNHEREIASAKIRLRAQNPQLQTDNNNLMGTDQYTEQMMNQINQINFAYNSSPEKIVPVGVIKSHNNQQNGQQFLVPVNEGQFFMHGSNDQNQYIISTQSMNGIKDIILQSEKFNSQNNLRGVNSISSLQKDHNNTQNIVKMPTQFNRNEYVTGVQQHHLQNTKKSINATKKRANQIIATFGPEAVNQQNQTVRNSSNKHVSSAKKSNKGDQNPFHPQAYVVTSGLITDHKEGLNNLFVAGESQQNKQSKSLGQSLFMKYVKKKANLVKVYSDQDPQNPQQFVLMNLPPEGLMNPQKTKLEKQVIPESAMTTNEEAGKKKSFKIIQNESQNNIVILRSDIQEPWTDKKHRKPKLIQSEERGNLTDIKQSAARIELRGQKQNIQINNHRNLIPQNVIPKRAPSARALLVHQRGIHQKEISHSSEAALGTQELMNEIKQLKDHQQKQLNIFYKDLQQSLNQQIQLQLKQNYSKVNDPGPPVQQFVNFNQYNMFNERQNLIQSSSHVNHHAGMNQADLINQKKSPSKESGKKYSAKSNKHPHREVNPQNYNLHGTQIQIPVNGLLSSQHPTAIPLNHGSIDQHQINPNSFNMQSSKNMQVNPKKVQQREGGKLEAHDMIPLGLQSLMGGNIQIVPKTKGTHQMSNTNHNSFNTKNRGQNFNQGSETLKNNEKNKFSEPYLGKNK